MTRERQTAERGNVGSDKRRQSSSQLRAYQEKLKREEIKHFHK
jgi:hypothetical protein